RYLLDDPLWHWDHSALPAFSQDRQIEVAICAAMQILPACSRNFCDSAPRVVGPKDHVQTEPSRITVAQSWSWSLLLFRQGLSSLVNHRRYLHLREASGIRIWCDFGSFHRSGDVEQQVAGSMSVAQ